MKITVLIVAALSFASWWNQSGTSGMGEEQALKKGQDVLVSTFDKSLPKVSLKYFLESEADGARIAWEVNDCGEQTGDPKHQGAEFPICVEASFRTADGRIVDVMVAVGGSKKGLSSTPSLFSSTITDDKSVAHSVPLIQLPAKIHRNGKWLPHRKRKFPSTEIS